LNANKRKVFEYLQDHKEANDEEIAQALGLHIVDVLQALVLLEQDGLVRSVD